MNESVVRRLVDRRDLNGLLVRYCRLPQWIRCILTQAIVDDHTVVVSPGLTMP